MNSDDSSFSNKPQNQPSTSFSLAHLLQEIEDWRAAKAKDEPIPDELWEKIFSFSRTHSTTRLCAILGINHSQYRKKQEQFQKVISLQERLSSSSSTIKAESLSSVPPSEEEEDWEELQSENAYDPITGLSLHTIIVELCRADGHRLKIHTTTQSFKELFQLFFNNEAPYDTTKP